MIEKGSSISFNIVDFLSWFSRNLSIVAIMGVKGESGITVHNGIHFLPLLVAKGLRCWQVLGLGTRVTAKRFGVMVRG